MNNPQIYLNIKDKNNLKIENNSNNCAKEIINISEIKINNKISFNSLDEKINSQVFDSKEYKRYNEIKDTNKYIRIHTDKHNMNEQNFGNFFENINVDNLIDTNETLQKINDSTTCTNNVLEKTDLLKNNNYMQNNNILNIIPIQCSNFNNANQENYATYQKNKNNLNNPKNITFSQDFPNNIDMLNFSKKNVFFSPFIQNNQLNSLNSLNLNNNLISDFTNNPNNMNYYLNEILNRNNNKNLQTFDGKDIENFNSNIFLGNMKDLNLQNLKYVDANNSKNISNKDINNYNIINNSKNLGGLNLVQNTIHQGINELSYFENKNYNNFINDNNINKNKLTLLNQPNLIIDQNLNLVKTNINNFNFSDNFKNNQRNIENLREGNNSSSPAENYDSIFGIINQNNLNNVNFLNNIFNANVVKNSDEHSQNRIEMKTNDMTNINNINDIKNISLLGDNQKLFQTAAKNDINQTNFNSIITNNYENFNNSCDVLKVINNFMRIKSLTNPNLSMDHLLNSNYINENKNNSNSNNMGYSSNNIENFISISTNSGNLKNNVTNNFNYILNSYNLNIAPQTSNNDFSNNIINNNLNGSGSGNKSSKNKENPGKNIIISKLKSKSNTDLISKDLIFSQSSNNKNRNIDFTKTPEKSKENIKFINNSKNQSEIKFYNEKNISNSKIIKMRSPFSLEKVPISRKLEDNKKSNHRTNNSLNFSNLSSKKETVYNKKPNNTKLKKRTKIQMKKCKEKISKIKVNFNNDPLCKMNHDFNCYKEFFFENEINDDLKKELETYKDLYKDDLQNILKDEKHLFMKTHFPEMYIKIENFYFNIKLLNKKRKNSARINSAYTLRDKLGIFTNKKSKDIKRKMCDDNSNKKNDNYNIISDIYDVFRNIIQNEKNDKSNYYYSSENIMKNSILGLEFKNDHSIAKTVNMERNENFLFNDSFFQSSLKCSNEHKDWSNIKKIKIENNKKIYKADTKIEIENLSSSNEIEINLNDIDSIKSTEKLLKDNIMKMPLSDSNIPDRIIHLIKDRFSLYSTINDVKILNSVNINYLNENELLNLIKNHRPEKYILSNCKKYYKISEPKCSLNNISVNEETKEYPEEMMKKWDSKIIEKGLIDEFLYDIEKYWPFDHFHWCQEYVLEFLMDNSYNMENCKRFIKNKELIFMNFMRNKLNKKDSLSKINSRKPAIKYLRKNLKKGI